MSETLWKTALIPRVNYTDLTFYLSLQAPHPFNSLSCSLSPLNLFPCPSSSSWSFSCMSPKSTSLSMAFLHQISGSLCSICKIPCHIWSFETAYNRIQNTTERWWAFDNGLKTLHWNLNERHFYILTYLCRVFLPLLVPLLRSLVQSLSIVWRNSAWKLVIILSPKKYNNNNSIELKLNLRISPHQRFTVSCACSAVSWDLC